MLNEIIKIAQKEGTLTSFPEVPYTIHISGYWHELRPLFKFFQEQNIPYEPFPTTLYNITDYEIKVEGRTILVSAW